MKTVLVTGANGFIGNALAETLSSSCKVIGVGRSKEINQRNNKFEYVTVDLLDYHALQSIFRKVPFDVVYHFAGTTAHSELVTFKNTGFYNNLCSTLNLLKCFDESNASRFIFSSSGKVYGKMTEAGLSEGSKLNPSTVLGKGKLQIERDIHFFAENSSKEYVVARVFNVYGPGQKNNFVIPTILNQLGISSKIQLGNLDDQRDYVFLDDVIAAFQLLGKISLETNLALFNVASGQPKSVREIISCIEELSQTKIEVEVSKDRLRTDEHSSEYGRIDRLARHGWEPKVSLQRGLRECVKHYWPQGIKDFI